MIGHIYLCFNYRTRPVQLNTSSVSTLEFRVGTPSCALLRPEAPTRHGARLDGCADGAHRLRNGVRSRKAVFVPIRNVQSIRLVIGPVGRKSISRFVAMRMIMT